MAGYLWATLANLDLYLGLLKNALLDSSDRSSDRRCHSVVLIANFQARS